MKDEIKKREPQERTRYVPASVKVIEFTAQKVVCISPGWMNTETEEEETVL